MAPKIQNNLRPLIDPKAWMLGVLKKVAKIGPSKFRAALTTRIRFLESGLDKRKMDRKIRAKGNLVGLATTQHSPRLVVSLTTFPARMDDVYYTIFSLLNQSVKPDAIVLWLSEEECPHLEQDVPEKLLAFKKNGLSIKFAKNLRPYNKLVHSLREYPDAVVVTADDDIYYGPNWLEKLYQSWLAAPSQIHCHRAYQMRFDDAGQILPYAQWKRRIAWTEAPPSFLNFLTGVGGVLYPPHCFHQDVLREDLFLQLSPTNDDIWFWAMAVLNETKICVVKENETKLVYVNLARDMSADKAGSLFQVNRRKNDELLQAVVEHYGLREKLWQIFQEEAAKTQASSD